MFRKILIANRGEIAVRVLRACREMGIATVAVYSDVDRAALHVRMAGEAFALGPAPAAESYLNAAKILDAARRSGADALHPGYGFLAEDAAFARACAEASVKFIGPSPEAMEAMGLKTAARRSMQAAGVPVVPGTVQGLKSQADGERAAAEIGYPVLIKAAAGGGGKGMRAVSSEAELAPALEAARSEALRAFGNDEVYLEKRLLNPRHIEVQVLGDEHGNLVHLGERECSLQRRHQKVMEESPSPLVDAGLRERLGAAAVRVARAAGYSSAGTVEFLLDGARNFYFLEMNTRLQVEHPITEMVTGVDLVGWQIRIAAGERLNFTQEQVELRGHALECRIYAEDPDNDYFPSPGRITRLRAPSGPGIREDSGVYEGWTVPLDYDPLLAKLIVHAPGRAQAIARLARALDEYLVGGIKTNVSLFQRILRDPGFAAGRLDTGFLDRLLAERPAAADSGPQATSNGLTTQQLAAIAAAVFAAAESPGAATPAASGPSAVPVSAAAGSANGAAATPVSSRWKHAGRREALRDPR